jgi:Protein of unknown function (DUF3224)
VCEATRQHATGRIEVDSYQPKPYDESTDGPALVEVDVCEKFVGDIEGEGVVRFLPAQRHDGSASFVGGPEGPRGEGGFTADLGQGAEIALDYWFE